MKTRHLIMSLVLLIVTSAAWGQSLRGIRKVAAKQRRELKHLQRVAPNAAQRIQPAAAEYYNQNQTSPSAYYKYDPWGNQTEEFYESSSGEIDYYIQTWDNSHGYPVLLDRYSYRKKSDGSIEDLYYDQRTILNEAGIRITLEDDDYSQIILDAAGHVLSAQAGKGDETESFEYTWKGELLSSYKYDYDNSSSYNEKESEHININHIEAVYQSKPFNAYELDYYDVMLDPEYGGFWMNASGTYSSQFDDESITGALQIRSEVSADKKNLVMTTTVDGELLNKTTFNYIDENGSFTSKIEYADGDYEQHTNTYNEYGDLISEVYVEGGIGYAHGGEYRYEWKYDNGKPLQMKEYYKNGDTDEYLSSTLVFTAWHNGSSITTTATNTTNILGATLYTLDGVKVRALTAEEARDANAITAPRAGIYLLVIRTEQGSETRKVVISNR